MSPPDHSVTPPVGDPGQEPSTIVWPPADFAAPSPGVLVVDDEEGVRGVLGAWLWHHGFAVWLAADAREAVETYRSYRVYIGVALLDVQMPGRDGPGTLADLREVDPAVRACFMTGDAGRYAERDLLDLGALAVFRKPLCLGELAARLVAMTAPAVPADGRASPVAP